MDYTERDSKMGILARGLRKIFCLERVIIASVKTRVKTKILMQSQRGQKPIFVSRSVYFNSLKNFLGAMFVLTSLFFNPLAMNAQEEETEEVIPTEELSLIENIQNNPDLSTFAKALQGTDLANALKGNGPFTVFTPTNEAFDHLPPGTLQILLKPDNKAKLSSLLSYHVLPGKKTAAALKTGKFRTLNGKEVEITLRGREISLNGSRVISPEIVSLNGTIYIIDTVILQ